MVGTPGFEERNPRTRFLIARLAKGFHSLAELLCYSAQQESLAGSLKREIATIFNASAIVG